MKRILLITSANTGAGHRSITEALTEQFSEMPDVEVQVIDGFSLMGRIGIPSAKIYGFLTRHALPVYNASWKLTDAHPPGFAAAALLCRRRFGECVSRFQPDLILTVHSLFNTLLTRMLEAQDLRIPVVVLQADLINIHSTWCNPKAFRTICPTPEAFEASLHRGIPPEKLKLMGFPIRSRFFTSGEKADAGIGSASRPLRCLLMSGGEGCGSIRGYAKAILENTGAELTVVCGRNEKLRRQLQRGLRPYCGRAEVLGFVPDIEQEMGRSDLLITRGSPNTMLEAVAMRLPLIITGPFPHQEKDNPRLMQEHGLGVLCPSPGKLPGILCELLENDRSKLKKIRAGQCAYRDPDCARDVAEYAAGLARAGTGTLSRTSV